MFEYRDTLIAELFEHDDKIFDKILPDGLIENEYLS